MFGNMGSEARSAMLRDSLRILGRRRRLLLIPWAAIVVIGLLIAFLQPAVYESSVVLMLESPPPQPDGTGAFNAGAQVDLMSEQARRATFLRNVITASGIRTDPATRAWALRYASRYPGSGENQDVEAFLNDFLREAIDIARGKGSTFRVQVTDPDRVRARKLAEAVANQFVLSSRATQVEEFEKIQQFSAGQEQVFGARLAESEGRLEAFRRSLHPATVVGTAVHEGNVRWARTMLQQAQLEADDLGRRESALRKQLAGRLSDKDLDALTGGPASDIIDEVVTLQRQLASTTLRDSASSTLAGLRLSVVRKQDNLSTFFNIGAKKALPTLPQSARDLVVYCCMAQADLAGVEARRDWLDQQVARYEHAVAMTPDQASQLQRLNQEVETNRKIHDAYAKQSSEAQISQAFESGRLSGRFAILEHAKWPRWPARPNRPFILLIAILGGGLIGAGIVIVTEHHDESVKNPQEVESLLGLSVMGTLPRVGEMESRRRRPGPFANVFGAAREQKDIGLLQRLKGENPLASEFRRVALKLARTRGRPLPHTLAVTSATRGEGKSTTAAGLAITLARELRQNVLVVDFDLRNPGLHRALGLPSSSWGLAQILAERNFDERFVRTTSLPHLDFLPAGRSDRPVDELIEGERVEWFVREAESRYPIVILDCAANLVAPDALLIGRAVEGVLFVVMAGSTVRKAAENGVRVQVDWRDNIVGVLINDAGEVMRQGYGPDTAGDSHRRDVLAGGGS
jgi:uncharacterized protein involved in exopolysaccharide biosynthesis/Mrp family chromosome partitioning ATPase